METKKFQKYLNMIFDMEMSLYTQNEVIKALKDKCQKFETERELHKPKIRQVKPSCDNYFKKAENLIRIVFGGMFALRGLYWFVTTENIDYLYGLEQLLLLVVTGGIVTILTAIVFRVFIGNVMRSVELKAKMKFENIRYSISLAKYNRQEKNLANEILLGKQIKILETNRNKTLKNLQKLYSYNILDKKYQHNIVAISSFCHYLNDDIGYNFENDCGVYKLFEEEKRKGKIITNPEIIFNKFDDIQNNQPTLYYALNDANNNIKQLIASTETITEITDKENIQKSHSSAISKYCKEILDKETTYMTTNF